MFLTLSHLHSDWLLHHGSTYANFLRHCFSSLFPIGCFRHTHFGTQPIGGVSFPVSMHSFPTSSQLYGTTVLLPSALNTNLCSQLGTLGSALDRHRLLYKDLPCDLFRVLQCELSSDHFCVEKTAGLNHRSVQQY